MPIDDRRVTLKDIAEKTGFTVNTVSQYFSCREKCKCTL